MQCKALRDSAAELEKYDVAYFMISVDSLADNTTFAKQNGANFPILADADGIVSKVYGVLSERGSANRWTYFIDPHGVIAHVDRNVNPRTAGSELVAQLNALGVPPKSTRDAAPP